MGGGFGGSFWYTNQTNLRKIPYNRLDTYQNAYRGNFLPHIILIPIYFEHTYTVNPPNGDPLLPGTALTNAHFLS